MSEYLCKCSRKFNTSHGLSLHKTKADHWVYPKPVVPKREHFNYIEFHTDDKQWGRDMSKEESKHPSREELMMGYMALIIKLLKEIKEEIKRPKKII